MKPPLDNTPDLPPFTSPFNYVTIITISKIVFYKAAFSTQKKTAAFCMLGGVQNWH